MSDDAQIMKSQSQHNLAPVALFVYNRSAHTAQTLETLSKNVLAAETQLYVFCDGPKDREDRIRVDEVRAIVANHGWPGKLEIAARDINQGLAASIRSGIDTVLARHDRIIVIEDDIVTSSGFLQFMNDALRLYADDERVMNVSAYVPETSYQRWLPNTFFVRLMSCWGWGTWKRAWQNARWDALELWDELDRQPGAIMDFDIDGTYPYAQQLRDNVTGRLKTWAIFWAATCYLNNGLSLFPCRSLVRNIGFDGSGENCHSDADKTYACEELATHVPVNRIPIRESRRGRSYFKAFYRFGRESGICVRAMHSLRNAIAHLSRKVPEAAKEPLRRILGKPHPLGLSLSTQKRLRAMPRNKETTIRLFERDLRVCDAESFLALHNEIFRSGVYFFRTSNSSPVIIDAGADLGLASIYFHTLYPEARITAIESDQHIFGVLSKNLKSFELKNVHLIHGAAWDKNEELNRAADGADAGRVTDSGNSFVPGVRLRDLIGKQQIDFLKIDIEGAETRVLVDCEPVLKNVQRLLVKYHSSIGELQQLSHLLAVLEQAGFRYYIQRTGVDSAHPFVELNQETGFDLQLNIFAIRRDLL